MENCLINFNYIHNYFTFYTQKKAANERKTQSNLENFINLNYFKYLKRTQLNT